MLLEILKFTFESFWHFVGMLILIWTIVVGVSTGATMLASIFRR